MDERGESACVIVLAGQNLGAEELAAKCAGPRWDVAAFCDAYAAAVELLLAERTVLVFSPSTMRPWQRPLVDLACRRGIPVLACGSQGLAANHRQCVQVVKGEDLGEFITAALADRLGDPTKQAAEAAQRPLADESVPAGPAPSVQFAQPSVPNGTGLLLTPEEIAALLKSEP
jgi:hypothetical protein